MRCLPEDGSGAAMDRDREGTDGLDTWLAPFLAAMGRKTHLVTDARGTPLGHLEIPPSVRGGVVIP